MIFKTPKPFWSVRYLNVDIACSILAPFRAAELIVIKVSFSAPEKLTHWLLGRALAQLDKAGADEAAIHVNNALEILKNKARPDRFPS